MSRCLRQTFLERWLVPVFVLILTLNIRGQDASPFRAYDVFVDAGDSAIAVYQLEIRVRRLLRAACRVAGLIWEVDLRVEI